MTEDEFSDEQLEFLERVGGIAGLMLKARQERAAALRTADAKTEWHNENEAGLRFWLKRLQLPMPTVPTNLGEAPDHG